MPYINADENGIQGSSSVKDVETMLQLVHLYLTQPRKDSTLFASWLSKQKSSLEFIMKNPRAAFQDTLYKIIYNNNPWMDPIPKIADLDRINLDSSMAIYHHIFDNAWGLHFTFVGNIDSAKLIPLLQQYLGSLPGKQQDNSATDVGARLVTGQTDIALKKGKATQALITLRFEGNTDFTRSNRLHLAALLEVLNIEIIEKLREEMSGMYGGGMGGSIENRPYPHYVVQASIPCGPENVDTLTAALLTLIRNARDKGVAQANLDKVKETWRKQYRVNLQNNGYWLETLSNSFINNSNPMDILDYEQVIDAITVGDLQQAAQTYLTPDNMVKAVLYPESARVQEHVTVGNKAKGF
jgi:zinc protease